jgi:hypothetical protein
VQLSNNENTYNGTTTNGSVTLSNVVDGSYTYTVTKTNYDTVTKSVTISGDETINVTMQIKTGTVSISVLDGTNSGVANAVITLTDTNNSSNKFATSNSGTGSSGGATISSVKYGTYKVTLDLTNATGYTAPTSIDNLVVDSSAETLNIKVTKN